MIDLDNYSLAITDNIDWDDIIKELPVVLKENYEDEIFFKKKEKGKHKMSEDTQNKHLGLLGLKVKDKVTGNKGVVTSICFDLYGCIQAIVQDSKSESKWYDVTRLEIKSNKPVMDLPDFEAGYVADGKKGPADKPIP